MRNKHGARKYRVKTTEKSTITASDTSLNTVQDGSTIKQNFDNERVQQWSDTHNARPTWSKKTIKAIEQAEIEVIAAQKHNPPKRIPLSKKNQESLQDLKILRHAARTSGCDSMATLLDEEIRIATRSIKFARIEERKRQHKQTTTTIGK